jgi:primosomal protein N' (replication factor Y)
MGTVMTTQLSASPANYQSDSQNYNRQLVQVLVDCHGIEGLLTYAIPVGMQIEVGDILTVPLGARYVGAIALSFVDASEQPEFEGAIKPVSALVSTGIFPTHYWQLLARTAEYYRTPLIQTVKTALPPKLMDRGSYRIRINSQMVDIAGELPSEENLSSASQAVWQFLCDRVRKGNSKGVTQRYLHQQLGRATQKGLKELQQLGYISTYLEPPQRPQPKYEDFAILLRSPDEQLTTRQREVLTILQRLGGDILRSQLIEQAKTTHPSLQNLAKKGYIAIEARECLRLGDKTHFVAADRPKQLTTAQARALEQIQALTSTSTLLLHGVTGSGKTEVYLQAIAPILAQGKSALVLVPEIGLTPQLMDRFRARFGDRYVNAYHSQLSDGERFDTWRQMLSGEPQIVIGTRSAVFAPLHQLGLIVLDEEHDASFKQDRPQPCYHARTVAQWRSELEDCPLLLGSATPSSDMLYLIKGVSRKDDLVSGDRLDSPPMPSSKLQYLTLPDRIGNKPMPPIAVVDMREELKSGNWSIFSRQLQAAIATMQIQGKQGILFIHRRGHSTFVSCRTCGHVMMCPHCDVSLSYHVSPTTKTNQEGDLRCHYCNHVQTKPRNCPACGSPYFKHFGSGTQKVEQELAELFPDLRLIRFDSDTTRNKDQHRSLLEKFQAGEADLLIGTQMIAKGLDIPQVTLVGVISADGLLNFSDYRAGERAFQTLTQVAGRAGRGEEAGEAIIQTYTPEHPVIQAVRAYDFDRFIQSELAHREALCYPPIGQMALIHLTSTDAIAVETAADRLAEYLQTQGNDWEVLGPAPAAVTRVKNRYRWQILLKFNTSALSRLPHLETLRSVLSSKLVRLAIDIDPLTIL